MELGYASPDGEEGYPGRVGFSVRYRLEAVPDRELVRRGMTLFALPTHALDGAKAVWGTVDRIWEAWLVEHGRTYLPPDSESAELAGYRLGDAMDSLLTRDPVTPADVLDVAALSTYDVLPGP